MTDIDMLGHNSQDTNVTIELRLFNSLAGFAEGGVQTLTLPAGATIGDIIGRFGIPKHEVFLVMVNGRDATPSLYGGINTAREVEDGDVVALSGPVPYSWGYGACIV